MNLVLKSVSDAAYARVAAFHRGLQRQLRQARDGAERAPTPAQREAGNYRKGHVRLHGLDISIENPKGSTRTAVDGSWSRRMAHDYGYIRSLKPARAHKSASERRVREPEGRRDAANTIPGPYHPVNFGEVVRVLLAPIRKDESTLPEHLFESTLGHADRSRGAGLASTRTNDPDGALNVATGLLRSVDAGIPKVTEYRRAADSHLFGDPLVGETLRTQGFHALDRDLQSVVQAHVVAALQDPEVFRAIIQCVPIDVVDMLIPGKASPDDGLHHQTMLLDRLAVPLDQAIGESVARFIDAVATNLPVALASWIAKELPASRDVVGGSHESGTATVTGDGRHAKQGNTIGADGDHVDVFIGDHPESQLVFIVDQVDRHGKFDEHKVVIGARNAGEARAIYQANYPAGWRVGPVTALTIDQFKAWLANGDTTKPIAARVRLVVKAKNPGVIRSNPKNRLAVDRLGRVHWLATLGRRKEKPAAKTKLRLYRAADDDLIVGSASFSTSLDAARAYQDNPGFGGANLYVTDVEIDPKTVLDLYDEPEPVARLADLLGVGHPGAIEADEWVPRVSYDIRDLGYEWVRVCESYPTDTETWIFVGSEDPELTPLDDSVAKAKKPDSRQLSLFGPRKEVERPGIRGGRYYVTDSGRIEYGERPLARRAARIVPGGRLHGSDEETAYVRGVATSIRGGTTTDPFKYKSRHHQSVWAPDGEIERTQIVHASTLKEYEAKLAELDERYIAARVPPEVVPAVRSAVQAMGHTARDRQWKDRIAAARTTIADFKRIAAAKGFDADRVLRHLASGYSPDRAGTVEAAAAIAREAHRGQKRPFRGEPYIEHVAAVAAAVADDPDPDATTVAWLHDVVEDSPAWTFERLAKRGFSPRVIAAVDALSRRKGEAYRDFILRVKRNPLATKVKLADLAHNSAGLRAIIDTPDAAALTKDLRDTERRLEKLREAYAGALLGGSQTRARTTTYNARAGSYAERRDELRKMLAKRDRAESLLRRYEAAELALRENDA